MKKHATRRNHVVISLVLLAFFTPSLAGRIIYVKQGGTGDGSSWADANGILQQAINAASAGDQVWVAKGTYKPTVEVGGSGDRYKTFQMKNAVAIYGGFAGNEPNTFDINDRDLIAYETILSGDLLGNDTPGLDPCDLLDDPNRADNCYHIFYHPDGLALDPNAILNGFTITAGNANAGNTYPHNAGSGMFNKNSSPTVTNCTFTGNSADYFGGGMHNEFFSSPTVSNCTFSGNSAGERGGGMYNSGNSSSPTVTNCTFTGNSAGGSGGWGDNGGGGMFNRNGSPIVTNCTFSGNSAGYFGGGMYNSGSSSSPTVTNCTFTGNSADLGLGGGMFNNDSSPTVTNSTFSGNSAVGMFNYLNSNPTVTNCTFTGNSADYEGGGMYNDGNHTTVANCTFSGNSAGERGGGMYNYYSSSPTVSNCILWDNTATSDGNEIYNDPDISHPANPLISYCDIAGSGGSTSWDPNLGSDADGNIDVDPLFVDANGPDGIAGTADDNLRLLWGSPCINAGDPNYVAEPNETDLDGLPRVIGSRVDMGAYEFNHQPVADAGPNQIAYAWIDGYANVNLDGSGSYDDDNDVLDYYWSWTIDGNTFTSEGPDGIVNMLDFAAFAKQWPQSENPFTDLSILTKAWLSTPASPNWNRQCDLDLASAGAVLTIELPIGEHIVTLVVNDGVVDSEPDQLTITVIEPVESLLRIYPRTLNRTSRGKYIIAFLQLPPGITKDQIADEKLLLYPGNITAIRQFVLKGCKKHHKKGAKILAFFSKADLLAAIPENGRTDLEVTGRLTTGQIFYGTDSIRIIDPKNRPRPCENTPLRKQPKTNRSRRL